MIAAVGGLLGRAPVAGWAMILGAVAIAGVPPFALFISEFEILRTGFVATPLGGLFLLVTAYAAHVLLALIFALLARRVLMWPPRPYTYRSERSTMWIVGPTGGSACGTGRRPTARACRSTRLLLRTCQPSRVRIISGK